MRAFTLVAALIACTGGVARAEERVSPDVVTAVTFVGATACLPLYLGASTAHGERTQQTLAILAVTSVLVGPSIGRWYAHDPAWGGIVFRGLGIAAVVAGAGAGGDEPVPWPILMPGVLIIGAGTIYDLYRTPRSVQERNRSVRVLPTVLITPANDPVPGLALGGGW